MQILADYFIEKNTYIVILKSDFYFLYFFMKRLSIIPLFLWFIIWSYTFAACIEWAWTCNDTIDSKQVPSDQDIQLLLNVWAINATKQEVEKFWLEQIKAYVRSLNNSITTQQSVKQANIAWKITREEMAKMITNYAINILWKTPDTSKTCLFIDSNINPDLVQYVTKSCQLWLMGQWVTSFRPKDNVTRAEFWTVLSRALWWSQNEWWVTYYQNHLKTLKAEWIMNNISSPMDKEVRGYVMLMMMRSVNDAAEIQQKTNTDDQIADVIKMLD